MSETTLTRHGWRQLIEGNIEWLEKQPRSLERDHLILMMRHEFASRTTGRTWACPTCARDLDHEEAVHVCPACREELEEKG